MNLKHLPSPFLKTHVFGFCILTNTSLVTATPAPVFRPVIADIQQQLPPETVMRLPAFIKAIDYHKKEVPLYSDVGANENSGYFIVTLYTQPNCDVRSCYWGAIMTSGGKANHYNRINGLSKSYHVESIVLKKGIRGTFYEEAAFKPRRMQVIWLQDDQVFEVSLPVSPALSVNRNKQLIINVAKSMANEPPIRRGEGE